MSKYKFILPLLFLVLFSQLMAQQSLIDKGLNAEKLGLPSRAEEYYRQSLKQGDHMKNQYVGDIGDYGKYGLLRFLARQGIRIGIN